MNQLYLRPEQRYINVLFSIQKYRRRRQNDYTIEKINRFHEIHMWIKHNQCESFFCSIFANGLRGSFIFIILLSENIKLEWMSEY